MKKVLIVNNMPLGFKLPKHLASDVEIILLLEDTVRSIKDIDPPMLTQMDSFLENDKPNYLTSKKLPKRKK